MGVVDLSKTLKGKAGWVSLSKDYKKIIATGKSLKELVEKLKRMGNPEGYITQSGKDYSRYVG